MTTPTRTGLASIDAPKVYRATATVIFLIGVALHSLRLMIGPERLSDKYFTPPVDGAFGLLMLVSAAAGWLSFRRFTGSRALRVAFLIGLAMITISIPIHLRGLAVWSTHYIVNFPAWYSVAEIPLFLCLAYVVTRLRFRRE
jgi:uncharacterized membrane protein